MWKTKCTKDNIGAAVTEVQLAGGFQDPRASGPKVWMGLESMLEILAQT